MQKKSFEEFCGDLADSGSNVSILEAKKLYDEQNPTNYKNLDEFVKITTVGELKKCIQDLPDGMKLGKWDGCENIFYEWVNGAPSTMYKRYDFYTPYGGYDGPESIEIVLSL